MFSLKTLKYMDHDSLICATVNRRTTVRRFRVAGDSACVMFMIGTTMTSFQREARGTVRNMLILSNYTRTLPKPCDARIQNVIDAAYPYQTHGVSLPGNTFMRG